MNDPHIVRAEMQALAVEPGSALVNGDRIGLRLTGELNCFTTEILAAGVNDALRESRCAVIELDIAGVRFIDSAGIRGLLHRRAEAERAGRRLILVNPTDWVRQVLRATGLLDTFGLTASDPGRVRRPSYHPRDTAVVLAESAAIRRAAQVTREQAAAQRPSIWP